MFRCIKLYFVCLLALILCACGTGASSSDPLGTDSITVNASVTSLGAGQSSLITATVTNAAGNPVTGRSVSFSFRTNNSGGTLGMLNNETKSDGKAMASYTAGANSPTKSVEDTIQVSISNGSTAAVVITRTAGTIDPIISDLKADPSPIAPGHVSKITAVVSDAAGHHISGETVTFTMPITNTGFPSLTPRTGITDSDGQVVTVYSPDIMSPTDSLDDAVQATISNGSSRAVIITRLSVTATSDTISITSEAFGNTVNAGSSAVITAQVKNASGNPVSGIAVHFEIPLATAGSGTPLLSDREKVTGGDGKAVTIYTAGGTANKTDVVTAAIAGGDTALVMHTQ